MSEFLPEDLSYIDDFLEYKVPVSLGSEWYCIQVAINYPKHQPLFFKTCQNKDYFTAQNKIIFESLLMLWNKGDNIDIATLSTALIQAGNTDLTHYLITLLEKFSFDHAFTTHLKTVTDLYLKRTALLVSRKAMLDLGTDKDTMSVISEIQDSVLEASSLVKDKTTKEDVFNEIYTDLMSMFNGTFEYKSGGVTTGLSKLDEILFRYLPNKLYIVAARPAMGKSALAVNSAIHAAKQGEPVLIFSQEMDKKEIIQRIITKEIGLNSYHLRTGTLPADLYRQKEMLLVRIEEIQNLPFEVEDNSYTLGEIRIKILEFIKKYGKVSKIVIDYLQLITAEGENRTQEISKISRELKKMAKEFNVPIIALSQLSRELEKRQNKRPQLSDLRESGSIEQDADVVIFIYRDEYYNQESEAKGQAEIIVSKHRGGALGTALVGFDGSNTSFFDLEI